MRRAFVLDPDSLRRIKAIVSKAVSQLERDQEVTFYVEREDDRFYETSDVEDVLNDPNSPGKRITLLRIQVGGLSRSGSMSPRFRRGVVQIEFGLERKFGDRVHDRNLVEWQISHSNREWALLLADELEPQLDRVFTANKVPRWLGLLFAIPLGLLLWKGVMTGMLDAESALSYGGLGLAFGLFFAFFLWTPTHPTPRWILRLFGPESVFLWGHEGQEYEGRERRREHLTWTIFGGLVVSLIGSGAWLLLE